MALRTSIITQLLIATLLFSGLHSLSSSVPFQFHVVKEQKTWAEAQKHCREEFIDLATIDDMTQMEKVKSLMLEAGVERAWIGLKNGSSPKWQWSLADRDFYNGTEAEFRNWGPGQPNRYCSYQSTIDVNCVAAKGSWGDFGCAYRTHFLCYNEKNSTHPYVLVKEWKTWADAQRYCREHHTDLASVRNQKENDQISKIVERSTWIGLFKDAWEWSNGSSSSFRHWGPGEPNVRGECTETKSDGWWNDAPCNLRISFICNQKAKRQIVRVEFQVDPQVNISGSAVQQAFLQQIQQRLRKSGMPADAKLTWRKQPDGQIFHKEEKEKKKEE